MLEKFWHQSIFLNYFNFTTKDVRTFSTAYLLPGLPPVRSYTACVRRFSSSGSHFPELQVSFINLHLSFTDDALRPRACPIVAQSLPCLARSLQVHVYMGKHKILSLPYKEETMSVWMKCLGIKIFFKQILTINLQSFFFINSYRHTKEDTSIMYSSVQKLTSLTEMKNAS